MNRGDVKRFAAVAGGSSVSVALCSAVGVSLMSKALPGAWGSLVLVTVAAGWIVLAIARRMRFQKPTARAQRRSKLLTMAADLSDVELGLAMVAGAFAAVSLSGGAESGLYPVLYGVAAFIATFSKRFAAVASIVVMIALEALMWRTSGAGGMMLVSHVGGLIGAAVCHAVFLRGLVFRYRQERERALESDLHKQRQAARDYRLISSALGADSRAPRSREEEELRLAAGAVESIREAMFHTLTVVKRAVDAETCALLWIDDVTEELHIREMVTDSEDVTERDRLGQGGVVSAVVRDRALLCLPTTRPGQIPYYEASNSVGAFVGVPVMDGAHLRGVLCADRKSKFGDRDLGILTRATEQISRIIESEQVFAAVERAKYEHERFYQASALLCRALTLEQVMATAFEAARQISDYEVGVVTLYTPDKGTHRVVSVQTVDGAESVLMGDDWQGAEFRDNAGLVSMVVKNRHYLPAGGELRDPSASVFTDNLKFRGVESLLVLPLLSADEPVGTLTLASRKPGRFRKDVREMLNVIASQVAVSMQNGLMYKKMETMATTDGLTGLTNHRTFQERFLDLLERADRHGYKVAVLLCDVDHFKNVNDTYGHPVGDEVLRQVAAVLQADVRKIDITARYGGEEFAVVLESIDEEGALQLANRIREDVGRLEFDSDKGKFGIKMSLGVACFPEDGTDRADLIERADHALYMAKDTGRNRVVSYQQFIEARHRQAG